MGSKYMYNLVINPRIIPQRYWLPGTKFDARPAGFWITNANNTLVGNHAVGGSFGYWYAIPIFPTGAFKTKKDVIIRRIPLAGFRGNVAHSATTVPFDLSIVVWWCA